MMMKILTKRGLVLLVLLLALLLSACGENASSTPDSTPDSVSSATPEGSASGDTGKMPDVDLSGSEDTETSTTAAPEGSASDDTEICLNRMMQKHRLPPICLNRMMQKHRLPPICQTERWKYPLISHGEQPQPQTSLLFGLRTVTAIW